MKNNNHLDRRSKYSMQVIRQALFELLETRILKEITVVDICVKADVNRGTFYKYYKDVPDLYNKIEDSLVEEICAPIQDHNNKETEERFFLKEVLKVLEKNKEYIVITQNKEFSESLAQKVFVYFMPNLKKEIQNRCVNASEQDVSILLEYVTGGCVRVVSWWLQEGMKISIDEISGKLLTIMLHSISGFE